MVLEYDRRKEMEAENVEQWGEERKAGEMTGSNRPLPANGGRSDSNHTPYRAVRKNVWN
jgi:hypothetical protein